MRNRNKKELGKLRRRLRKTGTPELQRRYAAICNLRAQILKTAPEEEIELLRGAPLTPEESLLLEILKKRGVKI